MTSLTINTTSSVANPLFSLPSISAISKKAKTAKSYLGFSFLPKHSSRKSTARLFAIDWDLNMNELEFE